MITLKTLKTLSFLKTLKTLESLKSLILLVLPALFVTSCEREPILHLHRDDVEIQVPIVNLDLDIVWDYEMVYGIDYDWRGEWFYGDDAELFGGTGEEAIGYHQPSVFELRRYFTGDVPYAPHTQKEEFVINGYSFTHEFDWGFYDLLVWNYIFPSGNDDAVSIHIDEETTLDSVFAYTGNTMRNINVPNKSKTVRARYQPEELFSAYDRAEEIDRELTGFVWDEERQLYIKNLKATLQPLTYIYLTQIILHNNDGRIVGVDGDADLSGVASSTNVNTGHTGNEPIAVNYKCNMKRHIDINGEDVDIVGGRVLTFGICNQNNYTVTRGPISEDIDADWHFIDCTFIFNNGSEKNMSFDVTDQVRKRYKGGVLTIHVNVPDIEPPGNTGGSGFDAVVEEPEEVTKEIEM